MRFGDYARVLGRQFLLILLFTALGVGLGYAATFAYKSQYRAESQVMVAVTGSANLEESAAASTFLSTAIDTYAGVVGSPAVLAPAAAKMSPSTTPDEVAKRVSVEREPKTFILNISATANDAKEAARLADAVAAQSSQTLPTLAILPQAGQQRLTVTQLAPAPVPAAPTGLSKRLALAGGGALGLITGVCLGIMQDGRRRSAAR